MLFIPLSIARHSEVKLPHCAVTASLENLPAAGECYEKAIPLFTAGETCQKSTLDTPYAPLPRGRLRLLPVYGVFQLYEICPSCGAIMQKVKYDPTWVDEAEDFLSFMEDE